MEQHRRSLRVGAFAIACALILRLGALGIFQSVADFLAKPNITSMLIYLETGRIVRFSPSGGLLFFAPESPEPLFPEKIDWEVPSFSAEDGKKVKIRNDAKLNPDVESLIQKPLTWDLMGDEPTVLIYHTHATESYTKNGEDYKETAPYRSVDEKYNMVSIGDRIAQQLEANGIRVLHDRTTHDYPSYNGSYSRSRKTVESYLKKYPSIKLVMDIHRDAIGDKEQWKSTVTVNGQTSSQLMVVMASNASGLSHPNWQENLALGLKLHTQLERIAPGICRPLNLRAQRFNQDESPGALLVEVGTAGNTHQEALYAAEVLVQAILSLAKGSG